jgi:hypothetical protein
MDFDTFRGVIITALKAIIPLDEGRSKAMAKI